MHPILFQLGPLRLHTYGLFAALGFLAAAALASRLARRAGVDPRLIGDALPLVVMGGLLGARTFYVALHFSEFAGQVLDIVKIWQGGLMWQGGFLGGMTTYAWWARRHKVPFRTLADIAAPSVALGQALGRMGCFFAGCCYGKTCDFPWAIIFLHPESLAPLEQPLHPTQIYDAGLNLFLVLVLLVIFRRFYPGNRSDGVPLPALRATLPCKRGLEGWVAGTYFVLAGLARLAVEPFRADNRGGGWGPLSATGWVSVGLVAAGVGIILFLRSQRRA